MNSIVNDLNRALAQQLLVNVYQTNQEVVYTGYVTTVSDTGIILATYDDYGLPDGAVFLALDVIDEVEFSSDDLDNMVFRIQTAKDEAFVKAGGLTLHFDERRDLRRQVLSHAWVDHLVVMLVMANDEHFYEGLVTAVAADQITVQLLNKFDYSDQPELKLKPDDIQVLEFQGQELTLQGIAATRLQRLKHVEPVNVEDQEQIPDTLQQLAGKDPLVALVPEQDQDLFFVGRINVVTDDAVIMNLVDMTGQFGGYTVMRLAEIHAVVIESDYLQTMRLFSLLNRSRQHQIQPVLNDERLFDPTVDQFTARLTQAATFRTIIRLKLHDGSNQLGYPSQVGGERFIFHEVEDNQLDQVGQVYRITDVDEIAFGYLDAYLVERQLRVEGDL
ncbi:hypothetical protein FC99_GL001194 [Levilactobacillus koreensis JCM 16448]|uniref:Uncharacterized protein n=1 Tax=Levilactobacillus koreensis TaxID=637971 RepID=A0AAC8UWD6_9LACO|nr:hypothetical protein [Levilactobacillus koreensis]AKP65108.1 hypothetical protein ABN16_08915 [Levilactobacillus koreensis]KRK86654.1 hypothetical protein FC99_GL001194 [Levilactobacillus koreensis JCM 16448]